MFEFLYKHKDKIESSFWNTLIRDRLEGKKATRISYRLEWVSKYNEKDRDKMIEFLTINMAKLYQACNPVLREYI